MSQKKAQFATRAVHTDQPDPVTGAHLTPIYQTSTFAYGSFARGKRLFAAEEAGYIYGRLTNPTTSALEAAMADLEGAEAAIAFSSGMAAISALAMSVLAAGDHVLLIGPLYGGTEALFADTLARFGVTSQHVSVDDLEQHAPGARLIYVETPTNPTLRIHDLQRIATIAQRHGVLTVADNTFSTPWLTRPIEHGIDVVVHSATKYLGGHGDALGGIIAGKADLMQEVRLEGLRHFGGCLGPVESHLFLRGIKTLPLRVERQCSNAMELAGWLQGQDPVMKVHYPGLPGHPGHDVASRQMTAYGAMLSLELHGGEAAAEVFLDSLQLFTQAVSLGDVSSLATHPASTTHQLVDAGVRKQLGVADSLVRLSVGIEDAADLQADLAQALGQVARQTAVAAAQ